MAAERDAVLTDRRDLVHALSQHRSACQERQRLDRIYHQLIDHVTAAELDTDAVTTASSALHHARQQLAQEALLRARAHMHLETERDSIRDKYRRFRARLTHLCELEAAANAPNTSSSYEIPADMLVFDNIMGTTTVATEPERLHQSLGMSARLAPLPSHALAVPHHTPAGNDSLHASARAAPSSLHAALHLTGADAGHNHIGAADHGASFTTARDVSMPAQANARTYDAVAARALRDSISTLCTPGATGEPSQSVHESTHASLAASTHASDATVDAVHNAWHHDATLEGQPRTEQASGQTQHRTHVDDIDDTYGTYSGTHSGTHQWYHQWYVLCVARVLSAFDVSIVSNAIVSIAWL